MIEKYKIGFVYHLTGLRDGKVIWEETIKNIIPSVGIDYLLTSSMAGGSQYTSWYIGLSETAYSPVSADTMASLLTNAPECTNYSGGARVTLTADAVSGGLFSNAGTPAVFDFTVDSTIKLVFITSDSVQLSTTGLLVSAVALPSPKTLGVGESSRVIAGLQLTSS